MKIVKVTWLDIISVSEWKEPEELEEILPLKVTSVGFLVNDSIDDDPIRITSMIGLGASMSMLQVFPKGCILEIEVLNDCSCTVIKEGRDTMAVEKQV